MSSSRAREEAEVEVNAALGLPRDARAVSMVRSVLKTMLRRLDAPNTVVEEVQVAVGEACSNVVRHAVGAEYRVDVHVEPGLCEIDVSDAGPGFRPPALDPPPGTSEQGRGLALIAALTDAFAFVQEPERMTVRMQKRWK